MLVVNLLEALSFLKQPSAPATCSSEVTVPQTNSGTVQKMVGANRVSYLVRNTRGKTLAATKEEKARATVNPGGIMVKGVSWSGNNLGNCISRTRGPYGVPTKSTTVVKFAELCEKMEGHGCAGHPVEKQGCWCQAWERCRVVGQFR